MEAGSPARRGGSGAADGRALHLCGVPADRLRSLISGASLCHGPALGAARTWLDRRRRRARRPPRSHMGRSPAGNKAPSRSPDLSPGRERTGTDDGRHGTGQRDERSGERHSAGRCANRKGDGVQGRAAHLGKGGATVRRGCGLWIPAGLPSDKRDDLRGTDRGSRSHPPGRAPEDLCHPGAGPHYPGGRIGLTGDGTPQDAAAYGGDDIRPLRHAGLEPTRERATSRCLSADHHRRLRQGRAARSKILVCERIPKADKLLRLEVDLGTERRQILSGIAEWYTPEDLLGRKIVVITNLAPRRMRGLESHGMLLAASTGEGGRPALATFADADDVAVGARLK